MAATTAYAHIGHPHPNDGGLRADYLVTLTEGDRPGLVLGSAGHQADSYQELKFETPVVWIPTVDHMLDDLVVLVAARVLQQQELLDFAKQAGIDLHAPRIECYGIPAKTRSEFYRLVKSVNGAWKLGLTVFEGSSLMSQLGHLKDYEFQVEVCSSCFLRYHDRWADGKTVIRGSLEAKFPLSQKKVT